MHVLRCDWAPAAAASAKYRAMACLAGHVLPLTNPSPTQLACTPLAWHTTGRPSCELPCAHSPPSLPAAAPAAAAEAAPSAGPGRPPCRHHSGCSRCTCENAAGTSRAVKRHSLAAAVGGGGRTGEIGVGVSTNQCRAALQSALNVNARLGGRRARHLVRRRSPAAGRTARKRRTRSPASRVTLSGSRRCTHPVSNSEAVR